MGCGQSTPLPIEISSEPYEPTYNGNGVQQNHQHPHITAASKSARSSSASAAAGGVTRPPRVESCEESIVYDTGSARIEYAFLSQRGYYPDGKSFELVLEVPSSFVAHGIDLFREESYWAILVNFRYLSGFTHNTKWNLCL